MGENETSTRTELDDYEVHVTGGNPERNMGILASLAASVNAATRNPDTALPETNSEQQS